MPKRNDERLHIRLPADLLDDLEEAVDLDEDADTTSEYVRAQLRAGIRITRAQHASHA